MELSDERIKLIFDVVVKAATTFPPLEINVRPFEDDLSAAIRGATPGVLVAYANHGKAENDEKFRAQDAQRELEDELGVALTEEEEELLHTAFHRFRRALQKEQLPITVNPSQHDSNDPEHPPLFVVVCRWTIEWGEEDTRRDYRNQGKEVIRRTLRRRPQPTWPLRGGLLRSRWVWAVGDEDGARGTGGAHDLGAGGA